MTIDEGSENSLKFSEISVAIISRKKSMDNFIV